MCASFWKTQPVGKNRTNGDSAADTPQTLERVRLIDNLEWIEIDDTLRITRFLYQNYVEDADSSFRLSYSDKFFDYLFEDPNHRPCYSIGVEDGGELVGYLLARPHTLIVSDRRQRSVSINFLCLSKKYRNLGLAPLLIKEATRVANTNNIFYGVFTGHKNYGFAVCYATYHHLPLDLVDLMAKQYIDSYPIAGNNYRMRDATVEATKDDLGRVWECYNGCTGKYVFFEEFTMEEFAFTFKNREGVFYTIYNREANEFASAFIIDTFSKKTNTSFSVAYLYYWHGTVSIIEDLIYHAQSKGCSLFNVLNVAANKSIIKDFNMVEGTGQLHYHLYNWHSRSLLPEEINFILF